MTIMSIDDQRGIAQIWMPWMKTSLRRYVALFQSSSVPKRTSTQFKVNTLGAIHSIDAFLPLLRKSTLKKIAIISTSLGERDFVWKARLNEMAAYSVTKSAEHMVMAKYAASLDNEGFIVAAINPGGVDVSGTARAPRKCYFSLPCVVLPGPRSCYVATVEEQASLTRVMEKIGKVLLGHPGQPSTPEQAVKKVLSTIHLLKREDTATYRIATLK